MFLAKRSSYVSAETALFSDLVKVGEERSHIFLPIGLRIFLVECLSEYLADPDIVHHVLAIDFLESRNTTGTVRMAALKRSGDASLILAGLFPERALRLNVSNTYFRTMGQSFYGSLAAHLAVGATYDQGRFYNRVAQGFESLERVLCHSRGRAEDEWDAFKSLCTKLH